MDLIDPFGRTIRDLRISVTDRCNFRCTYCMPEEGMKWLPRSDVLTFEEMERHILRKTLQHFGNNRRRAAAALGITTRTIRNRLARERGLADEEAN